MNRPISTRTHGVIDYTWATAAAAVPEKLPGAKGTASLLRGASLAASASSMITNYEAGVFRVMPMKGHLALDMVLCAALLVSPLFLPASERRFAAVPFAFGLFGLMTGLMTQTVSPTEQAA
jgi:hypothetical protein